MVVFGVGAKSNAQPKLISKKDTQVYGEVSLVTRRPEAVSSVWDFGSFFCQNFSFGSTSSSPSLMNLPLVSKEVPKALLPVANRPVLPYVLELLEQSNLKDLIVVVEGEEASVLVGGWITGAYLYRLHVEVAAVSEDIGTAEALRAISHHLTGSDILVVSGDLVCDVPPGAGAAVHRRHDAVVTAMLGSAPVSGPAESGSSGGKDKVKKPARCVL